LPSPLLSFSPLPLSPPRYPVFPWILNDYTSDEIDLTDPSVYRDLSLPMGALTPDRAEAFRERYEVLEEAERSFAQFNNHFNNGVGDDANDYAPAAPFHYGTHFSCSAYVLYYMVRLEPFANTHLQVSTV